ncbi:39S ribosomal protein L48, mitochondrial [Anthonomus grandis grandis]|uniref:39S ribosomal protein L48, mitochondrial n=1 Tax=Anthonomus grandis grandis TaxID=2921223 RepID=UPI0021657327|nr:39S ribosomal protein L48, mitochondrial [Anthonomus grandis grandis]
MSAFKRLTPYVRKLGIQNQFRHCSGSTLEPEYLEAMKSKVPLYDTLNIQLRGYDYPILENYQKYLHRIIKDMDINVEECWGSPAQDLQISTYKPLSEIINSQYKLHLYDRTVQITDVSTIQIPILFRVIEATTPLGVTVHVVPHADHYEEDRYVPDHELEKLKEELEEMGGPSKKK